MMQVAAYGRLGHGPRSIETSTGKTMAVGSIAVTLMDHHGEEHTQWLGIVAFGKLAEPLLGQSKGDLLSIAGRVQINSYTTNGGETRQELQIVADSIVSARSVRPGGARKKKSEQTNSAPAAASTQDNSRDDDGRPFDDGIPF